MRPAGGNHATLRKYALEIWCIPVDHFDSAAGRCKALRRAPLPLSEVLKRESSYSRKNLKSRLYGAGLKHRRCEMCGQGEVWQGRRMSLILDHINGVATDNRLENLRIVCPNCAATLDTHCGKNLRLLRLCMTCGQSFRANHPDQRHCSCRCGSRSVGNRDAQARRRRVDRPPYQQLLTEIDQLGYYAVGRRYGVSGTAVRKWVRLYERARDVSGDVQPP